MKNTIIIMLTALLWISCSDDEKVNIKPVAAFKTSEVTIEEGQHVAFTDLSFDEDGQVTKWAWDFGNGVSSEEQSPTPRRRPGAPRWSQKSFRLQKI